MLKKKPNKNPIVTKKTIKKVEPITLNKKGKKPTKKEQELTNFVLLEDELVAIWGKMDVMRDLFTSRMNDIRKENQSNFFVTKMWLFWILFCLFCFGIAQIIMDFIF